MHSSCHWISVANVCKQQNSVNKQNFPTNRMSQLWIKESHSWYKHWRKSARRHKHWTVPFWNVSQLLWKFPFVSCRWPPAEGDLNSQNTHFFYLDEIQHCSSMSLPVYHELATNWCWKHQIKVWHLLTFRRQFRISSNNLVIVGPNHPADQWFSLTDDHGKMICIFIIIKMQFMKVNNEIIVNVFLRFKVWLLPLKLVCEIN